MKRIVVKALLLMLTGILLSVYARAQVKPAYDTAKGFYDYQKKMNDYYDQAGKKSSGYKQWKRSEWYFSTRLDKKGKMVNLQQMKQDAIRDITSKRSNDANAPEQANIISGAWTPVGPTAALSSDDGIGRVNRLAFHPSDVNTIWAATAGGGLWKTTNGGTSWIPLTDGLPNLNLSGVAVNPANPNIIYILTGDGDGGGSNGGGDGGCCNFGKYSTGVLKSSDGGTTWNYTGLKWAESAGRLGYKLIMHPSDFNILLVGTSDGIFRTTNAGATWTNVLTFGNDFIFDIEFMPNNAQVVYAGAYGGKFFKSVDAGITWALQFSSQSIYATRISISVTPDAAAGVFMLVANNSGQASFTFDGIYYSSNMGNSNTWVKRANQLPNVFSGDGTKLVGRQEDYDHAMAVSPFNSDKLVTGGISIFTSTNGGVSVSYKDNDAAHYHADIHELSYGPVGTTLYAATDGGVYKSTNDGVLWTPINSNLTITQYYRISVSQSSAFPVLGGSQDNGTHLRLAASVFDRVTGGDGMDNAIGINNAAIMYSSTQGGSFYRSANSGSSFSFLINDSILSSDYNINAISSWVTPVELSSTNANVVFFGYEPLVRAINAGIWTFMNIGGNATPKVSGRTFVKVAPGNINVIYAGNNAHKVSSGPDVFETVLYKTINGGANWTRIYPGGNDDPLFTDLAMNPDDPEEIWVTAGGFEAGKKVYRSLDGGATWTAYSGSLPNVPVNCIVYDDNNGSPNDALYIGTDIGVFYRDNTLGDWIPFSNGLPVVEITDLEINEAAGLLRAGTYGRGIWETALFDGVCAANLTFSINSHPPSKPGFFSAGSTISSAAVISGAGATIQYKAGQRVTLTPGFRINASTDARFISYVGPCTGGGVPPVYYHRSFNGLPGYLIE